MCLSMKVFFSCLGNDRCGVTSTIIMGENDAILVDPPFTLEDSYRLLAEIVESRKKIIKVFLTNFHADYFLGLQVIKCFFPDVEIVTYEKSGNYVDEYDFNIDFWRDEYPGKHGATEKLYINKIGNETIMLEGFKIKILDFVGSNSIGVTPLWIPSTRTVIASDVVFSNIHLWTAEMKTYERVDNWMHCLTFLKNLKTDIVIPGHSSFPLSLSPSAIDFTRSYLKNFISAFNRVKDSKSLVNEMDRLYNDLPMRAYLQYSAKALKGKSAIS